MTECIWTEYPTNRVPNKLLDIPQFPHPCPKCGYCPTCGRSNKDMAGGEEEA